MSSSAFQGESTSRYPWHQLQGHGSLIIFGRSRTSQKSWFGREVIHSYSALCAIIGDWHISSNSSHWWGRVGWICLAEWKVDESVRTVGRLQVMLTVFKYNCDAWLNITWLYVNHTWFSYRLLYSCYICSAFRLSRTFCVIEVKFRLNCRFGYIVFLSGSTTITMPSNSALILFCLAKVLSSRLYQLVHCIVCMNCRFRYIVSSLAVPNSKSPWLGSYFVLSSQHTFTPTGQDWYTVDFAQTV